MEITFKKPSLEVGFEAQKIYPALEPLTVTPSQEKQVFNHPNSYGYDEVIVNEVEGEKLNINPSMEEQNFTGIYNEITVNPIECEEINITPSEEEQVKEGLFNKVTVEGVENSGGISDEAFEGETVELTDTVENTCIWDFGIKGKTILEGTPTIDTPMKIKNIDESINFLASNRNIANTQLLFEEMTAFKSSACRRETVDNKKCIVFDNSQYRIAKGFKGFEGRFKKNTRYRIKGNLRVYNTSITSAYALYFSFYDENVTATATFVAHAKGTEWTSFDIITKEDTSTNCLAFSFGEAAYWCLDEDSFIIEEYSEEDKSYIKNEEQTITFPLSSGQKLYEGSYLADDGIHNIRKQYVFTGQEYLYQDREMENTFRYYTASLISAKSDLTICTHLKNAESVSNINTVDEEAMYVINKSQFAFRLNKSSFTTIAQVKTYLAQQYSNGTPVTVEYELAQEQVIPYTTAQQEAWNKLKSLKTYKDITYITTTNTVKPILSGKYYIKSSVVENAIIDGSLVTTNTSTSNDNVLAQTIKRIPSIDTSKWTSCAYLFYNCKNLEEIPELDTGNVTTMAYMFSVCNSITKIPEINTSQVENFSYMFNNCSALKEIPVLDMSNGTTISYMFFGCNELEEIPEGLIFPTVTSLYYLFGYCQKLSTVPEIDASKVTNISNVFYNCKNLTNFGGFLELGKAYTQKTKNYSQYTLSFRLGSSAMPLTHESLMNIINNLYDLNLTYDVANGGTLYTQSLVLGSQNIAKLTAEEIAIATNKGWTVS